MSVRSRVQAAALDRIVRAPSLVRRFAGPPPTIRDQTVDADVWWVCSLANLVEKDDPSPRRVRREYAEASVVFDAPVPSSVSWEDRTLAARDGYELTVRVYTPATPTGAGVVFLHGGGFVIGDLLSHHSVCARMAQDTGAIVVAVHYRLAPEHPFPIPWNDAVDAFDAIAANAASYGISGPLAVAGDSAGGNLSLWVRYASKQPPAVTWAIYPTTDATHDHPSTDDFGERLFLTARRKRWFSKHTYTDADRTSRQAQPLHHDPTRPDAAVTPVLVTLAGMDILRDEGQAYIDHLNAHDVPVTGLVLNNQVHGFIALCRFDGPKAAWDRCIEAFRSLLDDAS